MFQTADLEMKPVAGKGWGVFARRAFAEGEVVETAPVIAVIEATQVPLIETTPIVHFYYYWGEDLQSAAVVGGFASFYNHSQSPNAEMIRDHRQGRLQVVAVRPIAAGEEVTFNYRAARDDEPLGFDPV
jgi:SET domain-containing protein